MQPYPFLLLFLVGCSADKPEPKSSVVMPDVLSELPDVEGFRRLTQSVAALEAVISPEWEYRYYSFDAAFAENVMVASMRDGGGDQWHAVLTDAGVALCGLAHESSTFVQGKPKPWVFADLPGVFDTVLVAEPAFEAQNSTYCVWRLNDDEGWRCGAGRPSAPGLDDGLVEQLRMVTRSPAEFLEWAEDYYELELDLADVKAVYERATITRELALRMNPKVDWDALQADLRGIGYP